MYLVASVRPSVRPSVCPSVRPSVPPLTLFVSKVKGRRSMSKVNVKVKSLRAAVDTRGSALPSAAKGKLPSGLKQK